MALSTLDLAGAGRDELLDLARDFTGYLVARNPYLRLVAVSGSLSRPEHAGAHEDIDFFIVTRRARIWEAFLGCLLHGWRFARERGLDRTFLCFNYLVDEAHPQEIDLRRGEYVREFLNLRVIHGFDAYRDLLRRHEQRLSAAEPCLYDETLRRIDVAMDAEPSLPQPTSESATYRLAAPAFRLLARRMEARRRRQYPGGHIYSNDRVIRSHFRRAWQDHPADEDGLPAARAFDALAPTYDSDYVSSPANRHMRDVVHAELRRLVLPGARVLDLGCGTGVDAVWLASRGARVLAVDVSEAMVEHARRNVAAASVSDRVEVRRLAVENLACLMPDEAHAFDLVLCNFGALNLAGEPSAWGSVIARLLKPEGCLVASVMNRWCLPELLAGLLRVHPGFVLRRARGAPIPVAGVQLTTSLYSPSEFARHLRAHFEVEGVRGLCVAFPPPTLEQGVASLTRSRTLRSLDRLAGRLPGLRVLGDHFLITLRPRREAHVLFEAGAPITASPVVADVNGDGAPEVVVAAGKLHVLDASGAPLHGWPRRAAKPIASTPAVLPHDGGARLFAGSDDHDLHAFDNAGRRLPGFPFPTGGDVFSSPWAGDLDGDGTTELAFGSDDGFVYAIDDSGFLRPGWPVRTGGYVSASPALARSAAGNALLIGSWDGCVYALDARGEALPGWPRRLGFPIWSTAALSDIDGDGYSEVIVAAHRLFALRGNGEPLPGFPLRLGGYAVGSPAVGDLDGDGRPEIVIASDRVYAVRAGGCMLEGFPVDLGAHVWASPLLVDVNGDGRPEIVVADMLGRVWALDAAGRVLDGWPRQAGKRIAATPTAADLDRDGYLELLVATWDGRVLVYPTDARADDHVASPWRTFPRREVPPEPLCTLPALSHFEPAVAAPEPSRPALRAEVAVSPSLPRPFRVTDVHLRLAGDAGVEAGLLYYELNGSLHPSPLLGRDGAYFGIVQPLPPLKRLPFHFELLTEDGATLRIPERGAYVMRVGRAGVQLDEAPR